MNEALRFFLLVGTLLGLLLLCWMLLSLRDWPGPGGVRSSVRRILLGWLVRLALLLAIATQSVLLRLTVVGPSGAPDPFAVALDTSIQLVRGKFFLEGSLFYLCLVITLGDLTRPLLARVLGEDALDV